MPNSEHRHEHRIKPTDQSQWKLLIHARDKSFPVSEVCDISHSGICLTYSNGALDTDHISIEYRSKVIDFRTEGAVMWKSNGTDGAGHTQNRLGLQLNDSALLMDAMQGCHG